MTDDARRVGAVLIREELSKLDSDSNIAAHNNRFVIEREHILTRPASVFLPKMFDTVPK